jgi:hypothetical protein
MHLHLPLGHELYEALRSPMVWTVLRIILAVLLALLIVLLWATPTESMTSQATRVHATAAAPVDTSVGCPMCAGWCCDTPANRRLEPRVPAESTPHFCPTCAAWWMLPRVSHPDMPCPCCGGKPCPRENTKPSSSR